MMGKRHLEMKDKRNRIWLNGKMSRFRGKSKSIRTLKQVMHNAKLRKKQKVIRGVERTRSVVGAEKR